MSTCKMCIEVISDNYKTLSSESSSLIPFHGAALINSLWQPGDKITISIMEDHTPLSEEIKAVANTWTYYANLDFIWLDNNDSDANIRIGLETGGSWSYMGTQCLTVPREKNTMNFGWLKQHYTRKHPVLTAVVLHEFGHALGMIHEHQHPESAIPWDIEKVYQHYGKLGWSKRKVDFNIFFKFDEESTQFSKVDLDSIMHYAIDNELTIGNFDVAWNTQLSHNDKEFIKILYPGRKVILLPFIASN